MTEAKKVIIDSLRIYQQEAGEKDANLANQLLRVNLEKSPEFREILASVGALQDDNQELQKLEDFQSKLSSLYQMVRKEDDPKDLSAFTRPDDPEQVGRNDERGTLDFIVRFARAADQAPPALRKVLEQYNNCLISVSNKDLNRMADQVEIRKNGKDYNLREIVTGQGKKLAAGAAENFQNCLDSLTKAPISMNPEDARFLLLNMNQRNLEGNIVASLQSYSMADNKGGIFTAKGTQYSLIAPHGKSPSITIEMSREGRLTSVSSRREFKVTLLGVDPDNIANQANYVVLTDQIVLQDGKITANLSKIEAAKDFTIPEEVTPYVVKPLSMFQAIGNFIQRIGTAITDFVGHLFKSKQDKPQIDSAVTPQSVAEGQESVRQVPLDQILARQEVSKLPKLSTVGADSRPLSRAKNHTGSRVL